MAFKTHFDRYVCEGDSITCNVKGITYTATLVSDTDSDPTDYDCYTKKQIDLWRADDWRYFGVVISAEKDGVDLGDHLASLWRIEGNFPSRRKNPNRYFREVANDLLHEAMHVAQAEAERIRAAFAEKETAQHVFNAGDTFEFTSYGVTKTYTVERTSRDGAILFFNKGRWCHASSVTPCA